MLHHDNVEPLVEFSPHTAFNTCRLESVRLVQTYRTGVSGDYACNDDMMADVAGQVDQRGEQEGADPPAPRYSIDVYRVLDRIAVADLWPISRQRRESKYPTVPLRNYRWMIRTVSVDPFELTGPTSFQQTLTDADRYRLATMHRDAISAA